MESPLLRCIINQEGQAASVLDTMTVVVMIDGETAERLVLNNNNPDNRLTHLHKAHLHGLLIQHHNNNSSNTHHSSNNRHHNNNTVVVCNLGKRQSKMLQELSEDLLVQDLSRVLSSLEILQVENQTSPLDE